MRICVLSDCVFPTPKADGHGLGLMAWQVAEGLRSLGHDVTLIAKEGSRFSGALCTPKEAKGYNGEVLLARDAMRLHRSWAFDAFLDHGHMHILSRLYPELPIVNVFHDMFQDYARCPVLLSEGQRALMPDTFAGSKIIPNALHKDHYQANYDLYSTPFVFFMGALSELKQPLLAIEACAKAGLKLVLAGGDIVGRFPSGAYENVEAIGAVSGSRKHDLLRNARVFLQLGYSESFGLTTLEANLCGTPVVAWPRGGNLDLIQYGVNGVFVPQGGNPIQAVADAIERAWDMDRPQVRAYAERFTDVNGQILAYEQALIDVIESRWW